MKIKQVVPVSGEWFVMLKDEDMPETCTPHPIAAWAVMADEQDRFEVLPLIAPTPGTSMNQLMIPDEEDVIGIADGERAYDDGWQAEAAVHARIAEEEQEEREATPERARRAMDRLCQLNTSGKPSPSTFVEAILKVRDGLPYTVNDPMTRSLRDEGFIREAEGGYHMTKLGDLALKLFR